jgi:hypothetical protein
MRRLLLSLALALAAPLAFAGTPTVATPPTDAQVDQLLELTHAQALLESMRAQVAGTQRKMLDQMLQGQPLSDAERRRLDRMLDAMDGRLRAVLSWETMRPIYLRVYKSTFEAQDLDAMIAFYRTPSGQRLIDRMPLLLQNIMGEMNGMLAPLMKDFQKELEKEFAAPQEPPAKQ